MKRCLLKALTIGSVAMAMANAYGNSPAVHVLAFGFLPPVSTPCVSTMEAPGMDSDVTDEQARVHLDSYYECTEQPIPKSDSFRDGPNKHLMPDDVRCQNLSGPGAAGCNYAANGGV
jgi:hypothetical protein